MWARMYVNGLDLSLDYADTSGDVFSAAVDRPGETIQFQRGLSGCYSDCDSEPRPIRRHFHSVGGRICVFAVDRASELDG